MFKWLKTLFSYEPIEMECIICKKHFMDNEVKTRWMMGTGDEENLMDCCPYCGSDLIAEVK
jgi:hypothetical protein